MWRLQLLISVELFVSPEPVPDSGELSRKGKREHSGLSSDVSDDYMWAEFQSFGPPDCHLVSVCPQIVTPVLQPIVPSSLLPLSFWLITSRPRRKQPAWSNPPHLLNQQNLLHQPGQFRVILWLPSLFQPACTGRLFFAWHYHLSLCRLLVLAVIKFAITGFVFQPPSSRSLRTPSALSRHRESLGNSFGSSESHCQLPRSSSHSNSHRFSHIRTPAGGICSYSPIQGNSSCRHFS